MIWLLVDASINLLPFLGPAFLGAFFIYTQAMLFIGQLVTRYVNVFRLNDFYETVSAS